MKFYTQNNLEVIVCTDMFSQVMHKRPSPISNPIHFRDLCKIKLFWHQIYFLYMLQPSEVSYFSLYKCYSMCNPVCMPKTMIMSSLWTEDLFSVPKKFNTIYLYIKPTSSHNATTRSNGLLSFNSSMNGGEFVQPHFQIRKFKRYLLLLTPLSGHEVHDWLHTSSPLLSPIYLHD